MTGIGTGDGAGAKDSHWCDVIGRAATCGVSTRTRFCQRRADSSWSVRPPGIRIRKTVNTAEGGRGTARRLIPRNREGRHRAY